jgi:plastocyanin
MNVAKRKALVLAAMVAAFVAPACTKSSPRSASSTSTAVSPASRTSVRPPQVVTVTVDGSGFQPKDVRMAPGTNVIWVQADGGPHVIVSGAPGHEDGKFHSLAMKKDSSFTIVAQSPGTYQYFDQLHPTLTAQFVVAGASASPSRGTSP